MNAAADEEGDTKAAADEERLRGEKQKAAALPTKSGAEEGGKKRLPPFRSLRLLPVLSLPPPALSLSLPTPITPPQPPLFLNSHSNDTGSTYDATYLAASFASFAAEGDTNSARASA